MVLWLKYEPQELVDTSNLGNEEWLSYRRRGIGAATLRQSSAFRPGGQREIFTTTS